MAIDIPILNIAPNGYEISTDRNKLDIGMVHEFLSKSY